MTLNVEEFKLFSSGTAGREWINSEETAETL